jgi:hypothetical protein
MKLFAGMLAAIAVAAVVALALPPAGDAQDPGLGHPQTGMFEPGDFYDSKSCGMCHPDQFAEHAGSMHDMSTTDPYYHRVVQMAKADVPGVEMFCSSCHAPIAVMTGQDPLDLDNLDKPGKAGVSCDVCHTISALDHIANFGFILTPGEVKYGPFGGEPPLFHTSEQSALHESEEFCGMCHNVNHPLNGLPLETTFTEFIEGPYPKLGYKCQTCHMTPGITEYQANPGTAANGGPEREHIWTHYFVGGNAFVTEMEGKEEHADRARTRLSMAAAVSISNAFPDPETGEFSFSIIVENVGCGHKIPTGVTEERQIWLEVTVTGADGAELAHFGQLDEHGVINEDTMILGTVFADGEGHPTHRIWLAESVISDRRIAPKDSDMETYSVPLADGQTVAKIEAQLWYRSSPQDFIDVLFADTPERELVPNIPMARAVAEFD